MKKYRVKKNSINRLRATLYLLKYSRNYFFKNGSLRLNTDRNKENNYYD